MTADKQTWVDVCALDDIPVRGSRVVRTKAGCIALFRTAEAEVFALDDKCPHLGGPLSQGIVHGTSVTCPLHNWVISLKTGEAQGADKGQVRTVAVKVENAKVSICVDAAAVRASPAHRSGVPVSCET